MRDAETRAAVDQTLRTPSRSTVWMDCTGTFFSRHTTGIQRVVRNLVRSGQLTGINCRPVGQFAGRWYDLQWHPQVDLQESEQPDPGPPSLARQLLLGAWGVIRWAGIRFRKAFISRHVASRFREWVRHTHWHLRYGRITFQPGDILLLPDATWCYTDPPDYAKIRQAGVKIGLLVYDIIPTTHPQFVGAEHVHVFQGWLDSIVPEMDFFVAISRTVRDEFRDYAMARFSTCGLRPELFEWFPMGVALDQSHSSGAIRPHVQEAFEPQAALAATAETPAVLELQRAGGPYMMVSTIEPRKNYGFLLDAFERVWQRGGTARLCLIGREGWLVEDLVRRIRQHPQLGRHLFWLNDLTDTELAFAYSRAKAFLFSSFVEGYGLPIAEALQHGLPVLVSDIPIHREVAGEYAAYFDPQRPETLVDLVEQFERDGRLKGARDPAGYQPMDWITGSRILLQKCHRLAAGADCPEKRRAA